MGASFPLLLNAVHTDLGRLGRRIGGLLTANIAGSALGSIVTGWVALAWLGSSGTLRMLTALGALFPLWGRSRRRAAAPARLDLRRAGRGEDAGCSS